MSSTEDEFQTRYQALPFELKALIKKAFYELCLQPGYIFLDRKGKLLSTTEHRNHPIANGYGRPDIIKGLLTTPRSDLETARQTIYSRNSWVMPYNFTTPALPLIPAHERPAIRSVQLECTEKDVLELYRLPLDLVESADWESLAQVIRCYNPWTCTVTDARARKAAANDDIRIWLEHLNWLLYQAQSEHLILVVRNPSIKYNLRDHSLVIKLQRNLDLDSDSSNLDTRWTVEFGTDFHNGHPTLGVILHKSECRVCQEWSGDPREIKLWVGRHSGFDRASGVPSE